MILGVTPARGGSKGLPRKNLRPLCGKPLLLWTLEAARASRLLDRHVVSTEDPEIAQAVRAWGGEVIDRPAELATDEATTLSVLQHTLTQVPADILVVLQAPCPVRDPDLIDRCIQQFLDTKADSLATGFFCTYTEYAKQRRELRRQDVQGFFYDDGNVYVMRADLVASGDRYGARIERVVTDREQQVDIDDAFDFWLAEQILKKRLGRA